MRYQKIPETANLKLEFAVAYNNRGSAYYQLGRISRSIQDYDRAIRALTAMIHLAPDRFENHCDIAMLHAHRGNVITAIEVLETVIAQSPDPTLRQRATGLLTTLRRRLN